MIENIIFRGKMDTGTWVQGSLYTLTQPTLKTYILSQTLFDGLRIEVLPSTVGVFTGFYDDTKFIELSSEEQTKFLVNNTREHWKGLPIFTGDIIEFEDCGEDDYGEGFDFINRAEVIYDNGKLTLGKVLCSDNSAVVNDLADMAYFDEFLSLLSNSKVIGNIYDYPDLLKMEYLK